MGEPQGEGEIEKGNEMQDVRWWKHGKSTRRIPDAQTVVMGNGQIGLKGNVEALMDWKEREDKERKEMRLERAEDRRNARSNRIALFVGVLGILATLGFTVYNTVHPSAPQTVYVERQTVHSQESNGTKVDSTTDTETKEK